MHAAQAVMHFLGLKLVVYFMHKGNPSSEKKIYSDHICKISAVLRPPLFILQFTFSQYA